MLPGTLFKVAHFGRGCAPANGIGCQFHGYFVLYTNLSFKEMSWIERGAYNRRHNMRSRMLMHTMHGVGIIPSRYGAGMRVQERFAVYTARDRDGMYHLSCGDVNF